MKRGGKKSVKINISNRILYTLIVIGILAVISVGVYASQQASSGGTHSYAEVGIPACTDGKVLKWSGGAWACGDDATGSSITDTRCDTSGTCSKVCIGSDCRTSWPAIPAVPSLRCPTNYIGVGTSSIPNVPAFCITSKISATNWYAAEVSCAGDLGGHLCSTGELRLAATGGQGKAACGSDGTADEIWTSDTTNNNAAYTGTGANCATTQWEAWTSSRNYYCCTSPFTY